MDNLARYKDTKKAMLDSFEREAAQVNVLLQLHGPIANPGNDSHRCISCLVAWPCRTFQELEKLYENPGGLYNPGTVIVHDVTTLGKSNDSSKGLGFPDARYS